MSWGVEAACSWVQGLLWHIVVVDGMRRDYSRCSHDFIRDRVLLRLDISVAITMTTAIRDSIVGNLRIRAPQ